MMESLPSGSSGARRNSGRIGDRRRICHRGIGC